MLGTLAKFVSGALQSMGKWDDLQATAWGKFVDATKGLAIKVRCPTCWPWRARGSPASPLMLASLLAVGHAVQVYAEQGSASSGA